MNRTPASSPQIKNRTGESGNAFFIIMVSVVLFAALMFTFSRGARQGGDSLSKTQAKIAASDILSYAQKTSRAINKLQLNGCSETQISFENNYVSGYENPKSPIDKSCNVFNQNGGSISYQNISLDWLDSNAAASAFDANIGSMIGNWFFPENVCVWNVGTGGTDCYSIADDVAELILVLPWVKESVCIEINKALGFTSTPSIVGTMLASNKFNGDFPTTANHPHINNPSIETACVYHASSSASPGIGYFFYHVLIPR